MSLSETWKAPLDLLEQELWTVEQGLFVCAGYFLTTEFEIYNILDRQIQNEEYRDKIKAYVIEEGRDWDTVGMRDNKVWIDISSGNRAQFSDEEVPYLLTDNLVRLWLNSDHDLSQRKFSPGDGSYFKEKWTKTYFINWALRHRIEVPWLKDAIAEGYVKGVTDNVVNLSMKPAKNLMAGYFAEIERWRSTKPLKPTPKRLVEYLRDNKDAADRANVVEIDPNCRWIKYTRASGEEYTADLAAIGKVLYRRNSKNTPSYGIR